MSIPTPGVMLLDRASRQFEALDARQRARVLHVLREMAAVVQLAEPSLRMDGLGLDLLQFTAAGVRVEYGVDGATGLLVVHELHASPYARTG